MNRWQNQEEAFQFAMTHPSCMLDMEMGTGKTRVAIDVAMEREDVYKILIVCPKAVIGVWRENLLKFRNNEKWVCWDVQKGTINSKTQDLNLWFNKYAVEMTDISTKQFVVINYDSVWRSPMGEYLYKNASFDMIILDESHRAKAASSKVSKYLAMIGKKAKYKMCLSGTPMANSPLDVYGQYRFLDPSIFGTRHDFFLQEYAIMGGPDRNFIVGFKNQQRLKDKFRSIAYTCKMSDIADRIKLPDALPPIQRMVKLPVKDMKTLKTFSKEFIAECGSGQVIANNVLTKLLRLQQITSGFCQIQDNPWETPRIEELNNAKGAELCDILSDISSTSSVVVFCVFCHDLDVVHACGAEAKRSTFEVSGERNELEEWKRAFGGVLAVQIQAGAEGIDMTRANHAVYFSIPHSLALYNQSKARLYRPGQTHPVSFIHLIAEKTVDEAMYRSLMRKEDVVQSIKDGSFDIGYMY